MKMVAGGTAASNTRGMLEFLQPLHWTLPQIQGSLYKQRENLLVVAAEGCPVTVESEGKSISGELETRDRVPMWPRPPRGVCARHWHNVRFHAVEDLGGSEVQTSHLTTDLTQGFIGGGVGEGEGCLGVETRDRHRQTNRQTEKQ